MFSRQTHDSDTNHRRHREQVQRQADRALEDRSSYSDPERERQRRRRRRERSHQGTSHSRAEPPFAPSAPSHFTRQSRREPSCSRTGSSFAPPVSSNISGKTPHVDEDDRRHMEQVQREPERDLEEGNFYQDPDRRRDRERRRRERAHWRSEYPRPDSSFAPSAHLDSTGPVSELSVDSRRSRASSTSSSVNSEYPQTRSNAADVERPCAQTSGGNSGVPESYQRERRSYGYSDTGVTNVSRAASDPGHPELLRSRTPRPYPPYAAPSHDIRRQSWDELYSDL